MMTSKTGKGNAEVRGLSTALRGATARLVETFFFRGFTQVPQKARR